MATVRTTITIDEELHKELINLSKEQQRSFSNQVVYLARKGRELEKLQTEKGVMETEGFNEKSL